jgi:hypothetical protein
MSSLPACFQPDKNTVSDYRGNDCNRTRQELSPLNKLFDLVTRTMEMGLNQKNKGLTFEKALGSYRKFLGPPKQFLYLLLTQGVNNVTEVSEVQLCYFLRSEEIAGYISLHKYKNLI